MLLIACQCDAGPLHPLMVLIISIFLMFDFAGLQSIIKPVWWLYRFLVVIILGAILFEDGQMQRQQDFGGIILNALGKMPLL